MEKTIGRQRKWLREIAKELNQLLSEFSGYYRIVSYVCKVAKKLFLYIRRTALNQKLKELMAKGAYKEAIDISNQILAVAPDNLDVLLQKGISLCRCEFYEEGITILKRVANKNFESATVFLEIGRAYSNLGAEEWRAIKHYDKALHYCFDRATRAEILTLRGDENMCIKRYREACNNYMQVTDLCRDNYSIYSKLGACFYNVGSYNSALKAYRKALDINPEQNCSLYGEIISLASLGRFEDALSSCDKQLLAKPQLPEYRLLKARLFFLLQRYEDAISECDQLLLTNASDEERHLTHLAYQPEALLMKGNALFGLGSHQDATVAYGLAIQLGDENCRYRAFVASAWLFECQKKFDKALESYYHALSINRTDSFVITHYYRVRDLMLMYSCFVEENSKSLFSLSVGPICLKIG